MKRFIIPMCLMLVTAASIGFTGTSATHAAPPSHSINFDDVTAPCFFSLTQPLTTQYESLGVTFSGPSATTGGAILNECGSFGVIGHSAPNFLAFNTDVGYPIGPETITFARPIHRLTIMVAWGGTVTLTAYDGATPVAQNSLVGSETLMPLSVGGRAFTSVQISFTDSVLVVDDVTWLPPIRLSSGQP